MLKIYLQLLIECHLQLNIVYFSKTRRPPLPLPCSFMDSGNFYLDNSGDIVA
jgi:hypothetical protein